jgi:cell fate regulator YaaT (PSP1 superfamily)
MQAPLEETAVPAAPPDGQPIVGVRFMPVGKVYHFSAAQLRDLQPGEWVIVSTTRGRQMGQVASLEPPKHGAADGPFKPIERPATNRDLALKKYWETQEIAALATAREKTQALGLDCKIIKAEYTFDGGRLGFLYAVEDNVEVNIDPLRTALQSEFNAKIDLRLVGPRDAAKIIGGGGACGLTERCCSKFLTDFSPISVKMAKEQGLSLNPQEITGMCGRLRCCLLYEYEQYMNARKQLPKRNKEVGTPHGNGKVLEVLPLKDAVLVLVGETRHEVARADLQPLAEPAALQPKTEEPPGSGSPGRSGGAPKAPRKPGKKKERKDQRGNQPPTPR